MRTTVTFNENYTWRINLKIFSKGFTIFFNYL